MELNKKWDKLSNADKMTLYAICSHVAGVDQDPDIVSEWLDLYDAPNLKTLFRITQLVLKFSVEQDDYFKTLASPILQLPDPVIVENKSSSSCYRPELGAKHDELPTLTEMWCETVNSQPDADQLLYESGSPEDEENLCTSTSTKRDIDRISGDVNPCTPVAKIARRLEYPPPVCSKKSDLTAAAASSPYSTPIQLGCYNEYLESSHHADGRGPGPGDSGGADGSSLNY